jgi:hypothetical protein
MNPNAFVNQAMASATSGYEICGKRLSAGTERLNIIGPLLAMSLIEVDHQVGLASRPDPLDGGVWFVLRITK